MHNKIKIYTLLHEQSISFAISAIGRLTNIPSVVFATSGPGATNLITGIGDCHFDSVPAIFITGRVNTHELKGKLKERVRGSGLFRSMMLARSKTNKKINSSSFNPSSFLESGVKGGRVIAGNIGITGTETTLARAF